MSRPMVFPPQPDEVWTLTDLATGRVWQASRQGTVDADGVLWIVQSEAGWSDGPPVVVTSTQNPRGDGATLSATLRGQRTVTLTGVGFLPPGCVNGTAEAARRRFVGMLGAGPRLGQLTGVGYDGVTQQLPAVTLTDPGMRAAFATIPRRFTWQATVVSADPLKYDPSGGAQTAYLPQPSGGLVYPLSYKLDYQVTAGAGGDVLIDNTAGTADTWPRIIITAPWNNPTVSDPTTGNAITVRTVNAVQGNWLLIECNPTPGRRGVFFNGLRDASQQYAVTVQGDWLPCAAAKVSPLRYRASSYSSSTATIYAPPAYW